VLPPAFAIERVAPDGPLAVTTAPLLTVARRRDGTTIEIAHVLDLSSIERPQVTLPGRALDLATLQQELQRDQRTVPRPDLRPFSRPERYRLTLTCRCPDCDCSLHYAFPVWDGDLVLLCYRFGQARARFDHYGTSPSVLPRRTLREFLVFFGETGADCLFGLYVGARTSELNGEPRAFADPATAASLSAVLAEQTYRAFVEDQRTAPLWAAFFAITDVEIPPDGLSLRRWRHLWRSANSFGQAHARLGLAAVLPTCDSLCLGEDLDRIADALVGANRDNALALLSRHRLLRRSIDPVARFRSQLRKAILEALVDAKRLGVHFELAGRWHM
jgi:hypothetical protein